MDAQLASFLALVRRFPWCAGCAIVTLVCGGGGLYLHTDIGSLAEPYAQRDKEYKEMLDLTKGGLLQRQELEHVTATTRRIEENLLVSDSLAENNWYFYKFEEQTKAHLSELHQLNAPPIENSPVFNRVPYTLRVGGTYEQIAAFINALETGPRLLRITAFSISRSTGPGAGGRTGVTTEPSETAPITADLTLELLGKK